MMICLTTSVGALRLQFHQHNTLQNLHFRNSLNQTLVNSHLEAIPGLGTFTARGLSGGNLEGLGWEADRALDAEIL